MFKTILFPVDQSRETWEAAEVVVNLVQNYQSKLILLSVVEKVTEEESSSDAMKSPQKVEKLLQDAKDFFFNQGIEAGIIEKAGKPAFVICDVADEVSADLVVMGCRGTGLIEDGCEESVSNRVINLAPCPVLVVP